MPGKELPASNIQNRNKKTTAKQPIIVMGASTGGFEAFKKIVKDLPPDLDASIFIVWHMSPDGRGILPEVLNKLNTIHAAHAVDREPILPNRIYVAQPDHHLLLEDGHVRVTRGPKENRFRPAVDPLFRSAAYAYGHQVIGVILSGALDDGTAGLWTVKHFGGIAIVQDPSDADVPSMPQNALRKVAVDHCVPVSSLADLLTKLCKKKNMGKITVLKEEKTKAEVGIAAEESAFDKGFPLMDNLSAYACPDCHGVLSKIAEGSIVRFRCHTGHAYSIDALITTISENIEDSLYSALRGMEENILLLNHMGDHYGEK